MGEPPTAILRGSQSSKSDMSAGSIIRPNAGRDGVAMASPRRWSTFLRPPGGPAGVFPGPLCRRLYYPCQWFCRGCSGRTGGVGDLAAARHGVDTLTRKDAHHSSDRWVRVPWTPDQNVMGYAVRMDTAHRGSEGEGCRPAVQGQATHWTSHHTTAVDRTPPKTQPHPAWLGQLLSSLHRSQRHPVKS
jgi:hypothetical protein